MQEDTSGENRPSVNDPDRLFRLVDNFRDSVREYMDFSLKSMEKASDVNKQLSAFHERLMLIAYGTIGLSVSALTAVAHTIRIETGLKYVAIGLVATAWLSLLFSAFVCNRLMMHYAGANMRLFAEWHSAMSEITGDLLGNDIDRLKLALDTTLEMNGEKVDTQVLFNDLSQRFRAAFKEKNPQFKKILELSGGTDATMLGHVHSMAIYLMQFAMLLLAISALVLVFAR